MQLSTEDRQLLVMTLKDQETMANAGSRRQMLEFAGLGKVVSLIDLSGASFVAVNTIVTFLEDYGRLTYDNESLGLFLNAMKQTVGIEQQDTLDAIILKYDMMEPIAPRQDVGDWKSTDSSEAMLEKVFGEDTLRPIAFLARGLEVARSVAYVSVKSGAKRWSGTGFMCAPDLFLTNHHVVSEKALLSDVLVRFNYQEDFEGKAQPTSEFDAVADGLFHANKALDYAIFQIADSPGNTWGYLPLDARDIRKDERINIIQHPNGLPKKISLQNNIVEYVGGNVLQYITSTNPGSSGSPVLDDGWEVVGLHHAGGRIAEPTTKQFYNRNEGILITRILADLPAEIREKVDAARA